VLQLDMFTNASCVNKGNLQADATRMEKRIGMKLFKVLGRIGITLVGLIVLALIAWAIVAGPVTVYRVLTAYGDTEIDDYLHYPGRELQPSESPFHFSKSETELQIPGSALLDYGSDGELEAILAENDSIAFLVIQGDTILFERYFQGHTSSSLSQAFSMSKSFTSALIGMAIDDGYIQSSEQSITDFIPELAEAGFTPVKIKHLLAMTSGSSYVENDNPFGEHVILNFTPKLEEEILSFHMERTPGELFRYKSGDNALLGLALDRALGEETITAYAQRRLWTPLGMEDKGIWTIDHTGDGLEKTWCCLAASPRDFAKLGRLYLNQGAWNQTQILSSDWVVQSTQVGHVPKGGWPEEYKSGGWWNYGYQWWLASPQAGDYFALGKDGQYLYINPQKDLIILRLGWSQGDMSSGKWISLFQKIADEVNSI